MGPILHWLFLFAFWLILSGVFDAKHIGLGIAATIAVAWHARPMEKVDVERGEQPPAAHLGQVPWGRIAMYSLWLLRQIVVSNIEVVRVVLDPKLPIDPAIVRVPTRVTSDAGITLLANSITATPGTITVRAADENRPEFTVHALLHPETVPESVREMEDRVLRALPGWEERP